MRARFAEAVDLGWPDRGWILKPSEAPAGYTSNTVLTEWLTLNCAGPWASQGHGHWIEVRFGQAADAARARAHFSAARLWRDARPAGFTGRERGVRSRPAAAGA
jgi:hypothetical protein